jgi:hypothetical protein
MIMPTAALSTVSLARLTALADEYAAKMVESLSEAESEEALRRALSGSYLSFLVDVVTMAHE